MTKAYVRLFPSPMIAAISRPAATALLRRKTEAVAATARQIAPRRSSKLANSVVTRYRDDKGRFVGATRGIPIASSEVATRAPHALYVLQGTNTPIRPKHGPYMHNPGQGIWFRTEVRGQAANNFLERALKANRG